MKPKEIPMTAKNVPGGVPEIMSTTTSSPEIAHTATNPASVQYGI
jgi:hypothetical protein